MKSAPTSSVRTSKDSSANAASPHGPPGSFTRIVRPAWPLMTMSCHPCSLPRPVQVSHATNKLPSPRSRNTRARAATSGLTNLHRCCLTSFVISLRSQVQPHQPTHSAESARAVLFPCLHQTPIHNPHHRLRAKSRVEFTRVNPALDRNLAFRHPSARHHCVVSACQSGGTSGDLLEGCF